VELPRTLGAVAGVPVPPGGGLVGQGYIRDFAQSLVDPAPRCRVEGRIVGEFQESWYGVHTLFASEHARLGQTAPGALANIRGRIIAEHIEEILDGFVASDVG
jgi:hypothetical protein